MKIPLEIVIDEGNWKNHPRVYFEDGTHIVISPSKFESPNNSIGSIVLMVLEIRKKMIQTAIENIIEEKSSG